MKRIIDTHNKFGDDPGRGWFSIHGIQEGERQLETQLEGLDDLMAEAGDKCFTVLDLGCAEGLVGIEFAKRGAAFVTGVELVGTRLNTGLRIAAKAGVANRMAFRVADLSDMGVFDTLITHDVVLALSVAHKMPAPEEWLRRAAGLARHYFCLRSAPLVSDRRSGDRPVDMVAAVPAEFGLVEQVKTTLDTMSIFKRR